MSAVLADGLERDLRRLLGRAAVRSDVATRAAYARDLWPRTTLRAHRGGRLPDGPRVVCWPEDAEQVSRLYAYATRHGVPLIPYGAGSGVCGGVVAVDGGSITIDLKRLDAIAPEVRWRTVDAGAGVIGELLERRLAAEGLTLGHFPSSIYCSTVGGWLAARSAGQLSTRYGKIEDMVLGAEAVLPDGRQVTLERDPDRWDQAPLLPLVVGSEGTLGCITRATLRTHPAPARRGFVGLLFDGVAPGLALVRALTTGGWRPAAVRLYDRLDTLLAGVKTDPHAPPGTLSRLIEGRTAGADRAVHAILRSHRLINRLGPRLSPGALLVVGFEGAAAEVDGGLAATAALARRHGGRDLGPGPGEHWWQTRYAVSYKSSHVYTRRGLVDTMEVAADWDQVVPMYHAVRRAITPYALVLAHFSHAYPEGCSIYFTFSLADRARDRLERRYRQIWRAGLEAVLAAGGTIAHHHGVGLLKAPWMRREYGLGMDLLATARAALDPSDIANPGKLGLRPPPDRPPAEPLRVEDPLQAVTATLARAGLPIAVDTDRTAPCESVAAAVLATRHAARVGLPLAWHPADPRADDRRTLALRPDWGPPLRLHGDSCLLEAPPGLRASHLQTRLEAAGLALCPAPWRLPDWPLDAVLAGQTPPLPGPWAGAGELLRGLRARQLPDGRPFELRPAPRRAAGPEIAALLRGGASAAGALLERAWLALTSADARWSRWSRPADVATAVRALTDMATGADPWPEARLLVHGGACWLQRLGPRDVRPPAGDVSAPALPLASLFDWQATRFGYRLPRCRVVTATARRVLDAPGWIIEQLEGTGGVIWLMDAWRVAIVAPALPEQTPAGVPLDYPPRPQTTPSPGRDVACALRRGRTPE